MDLTTPQSEGSAGTGHCHVDLMAACLPGNETSTAHWACGLPLSFVQETADLWLAQHDQTGRPHASIDLASSPGDPNTDDPVR